MRLSVDAQGIRRRLRDRIGAYLANADTLAEAANSAALLVWSSQPLYPFYVFLLVGRSAWPAILTWLSTPFFFAVPLLARRSASAGRALFVMAGLANTLLATKAFGPTSAVGWFLVPCLLIVFGFFRVSEWRLAAALGVGTALSALAIRALGAPLHVYTAAETASLRHLNLWSVVVLSIYLVVTAMRGHRLNQGARRSFSDR